MKKLFLISSYCDNDRKKDVLLNNLKLLKSLGVDTLLLSTIDLPGNILVESDFYFKTIENPVTSITEKTYIQWRTISINNLTYKLERFFPDYGWADLYQRKKLSQIALTYDYDIYYHIIYDTKIDEGLILEINNNTTNKYYSNKSTGGHINEFSLHFLPLNKEMLIDFERFLNKDGYVTTADLTHDYMLKWANKNDIKKSKFIVQEEINYYDEINFFSQSKSGKYDVFLGKDETNKTINRFVFYNVKSLLNVIVNEKTFIVKSDTIIDINIKTESIYTIKIDDGENIFEYIDEYNKLERTLVVNN